MASGYFLFLFLIFRVVIIISGGSAVKNLPAKVGDASSIPGLERSPGRVHGNPHHCSCLENPTVRGAWQPTVYAVAKSQTHLSNLTVATTTIVIYHNNLWALDSKPVTMLRLISPDRIFQHTETHSSIIQSVQNRNKLPPACGHLPFGTFGTSSQVCLCPKPSLVTTVLFRLIISWTGGFIHDEMKSF